MIRALLAVSANRRLIDVDDGFHDLTLTGRNSGTKSHTTGSTQLFAQMR
jgi:hypothetical protein